jgi:hypothetical protein
MASEKISQLPHVSTSSGNDLFPLVTSSNNYVITFANLQGAIASALVPAQLPTITLTGQVTGSGSGGTIVTSIIPGTVTQAGSLTTLNNKVFSNTAPMGLLTGATIVNLGGFTIRNLAGIGYVQSGGISNNVSLVPWADTDLTLPPNSNVYVYYDSTGTFLYNSIMPDTTQNVVMGRVVTNAVGIELVEESGFNALHSANAIGNMLRVSLGSVYVSGSNIAESGTRRLQLSPGHYFFGEREYQLQGGNPITFDAFYQDGAGGTTIVFSQTVVDNANWDSGSGTLSPLGSGNYAKHTLYSLGDAGGGFGNEKYFIVYSQAQYSSLTLAEQGNLPSPPAFIIGGAEALIGSIIVQQGAANIVEIIDERPLIGATRTSNVAATTFHHNLLGLNDFDDHLRYLPVDGSRPMTGNLPMGAHDINNVNTVNAQVVNVADIALGDSSTKAPNTKFVEQTSIIMALIFG